MDEATSAITSPNDGGTAFWQRKTLAQMTSGEWEALCDGCGRCCLMKLEDADTGRIYATDVACRLLDRDACRCEDYTSRHEQVPDCVQLRAEAIGDLEWLPPTCAYRLIDEGRELYWWHHLVSGDRDTVHQAGISVRGRTTAEADIVLADLEDHIVDWPLQNPHDPPRK